MMKIFEKKSAIKIDEDDIKDARLSSMDFAEETVKKRAFINVLGARLAMKLLFSQKIQANNIYSLYTIHNVLEELDLADIYYQGIKIDVRLVFDKNEIFIPRKHFEYGLLPDLYLVLCIKDNLSSAEFLGFFEPKTLDQTNANKEFYFYENDRLIKPDKLKGFLDKFKRESGPELSGESLHNTEALFLSLVDKEISKKDKITLYKQLANSFESREKVIEFENFEIISRAIAKNAAMLDDGTLDVVSGGGGEEEAEHSVEGIEEVHPEVSEEIAEEQIEVIAETIFDDEIIDVDSLPEFESEEEIETEELINTIYDEFQAEAAKQGPNKNTDAALIVGGAIVAAAGIGFAGEMIKGTAEAATASAQIQGAAISEGLNTASAGLEFGRELFNQSAHDINGGGILDDIPEFDLQEEDNEEVAEFEDFTQNDTTEHVFNDFEQEEIIEDDDEVYEIAENSDFDNDEEIAITEELPEFEVEDEFDSVSTTDRLHEIEAFEDESIDDISDLENDPIATLEIPESDEQETFETELPERQENTEPIEQDFEPEEEAPVEITEKLDEAGEIDEAPVFEDLMPNDVDAGTLPSFQDLVQKHAEENGSPDYEYLVQHSLDQTEIPDFGRLVEEPAAELPKIEPIEEIHPEATAKEELFTQENLPELDMQESAPLEDLQGLKDFGEMKIEEISDETKEEVFSLDDFDFNLLEERKEAKEEAKAVEPEKDIPAIGEVNETEEITNFEDLAKTEVADVLINTDSDDFISQVDAFLGEAELSDEQKSLLEKTLLGDEEEIKENMNALPTAIYPDEDLQFVENEEDKDLITALFEKEKINDLPDLDGGEEIDTPQNVTALKNKKMVIAASIAGVVLVSFVIGSNIISNQNNNTQLPNNVSTTAAPMDGQSSPPTEMGTTQSTNPMAGQMNGQSPGPMDASAGGSIDGSMPANMPGQAVQSLPGEDQQASSRDMGKAVSDAFSSEPLNASITKIAWEVPEDLAYNDSFRKYLQIAGKNLKLNLQNDLLLATEMAYSNKVIVDLKIGKDGSLQTENIIVSSGSKQIDKIVLQSVKDTIKYLKMPSSELSSGSVNATLIINF